MLKICLCKYLKKEAKRNFFCWKITVEKGKEKTYIKERGDGKEENRRKAMSDLLFFILAGLLF